MFITISDPVIEKLVDIKVAQRVWAREHLGNPTPSARCCGGRIRQPAGTAPLTPPTIPAGTDIDFT
jgi:hypothetical protein